MFLNALTVIAHRKRSSTRVPVRVATHREPDPRTAAPDSLSGFNVLGPGLGRRKAAVTLLIGDADGVAYSLRLSEHSQH
jgi:hypothetical protein